MTRPAFAACSRKSAYCGALAAFHVSSDGFSVHEQGTVTRHATYDRPGRMPRKLYYRVGGQGEGGPLRFAEIDGSEAPKPGPKRVGVERRGELLELYADAGGKDGDGLTVAGVAEALDVANSTARRALRDAGFGSDGGDPATSTPASWHAGGGAAF